MKLLIVDDEELTRTGVITSLDWASLGIDEVLQADDGVHGLETARLCKPEIILFDEAISSLDAHTQVQVMDLLRELKDRLGLTYIFITHDLTSITYLCDDVLFLYQGRVTENLPVERISETKDEYARKLLESIVVFDTEESA